MHDSQQSGSWSSATADAFGDILRDLRCAVGLTQEALAERAGLGVRTIQGLERGEARPLRRTIVRLVDCLSPLTKDTARLIAAAPRQVRQLRPARPGGRSGGSSVRVPVDLAPLRPARFQPTGLPVLPTSFIGRVDEVTTIARQLREPRLRMLTLTGLGGVGKTRLAIEAAHAAAADFPDGVAFAPLDSIGEPRALMAAAARALGLLLDPGDVEWRELGQQLGDRRILLVVDNCEQLGPAAVELSRLLETWLGVTLLATSRSALHLAGEHEHHVWPLPVPFIDSVRCTVDFAEVARSDAVTLFVERARRVQPDFALSIDNAAFVAHICQRVDGVPLAIELAALRVRVLGPAALARQLERRLPLLTGGPIDAPARQRTLRATLDWSYRSLTPDARRVLRCLGACAGPTSLNALEAIASPLDGALLDAVSAGAECGLVQVIQDVHGGSLVQMLDTVCEYAAERLAASRAHVTVRDRHADHYTGLAEREEVELRGPRQLEALTRLELEYGNLRVAVLWWIERRWRAPALRLASALCRFWGIRGRAAEGRAILEQALALEGDAPVATCLEGTLSAERLAYLQHDFARASELLDEALVLGRALGDARGTAIILNSCGVVAARQGELARARGYYEQNLAMCETLGDLRLLAMTRYNLGTLTMREGDPAAAMQFLHGSLATARDIGDDLLTATNLTALGCACLECGEPAAAGAHLGESLALRRAARDESGAASTMEGLAALALRAGNRQRAATLWGAATAVREAGGSALPSIEGPILRATARQLGEAKQDPHLHGAWADGHSMSLLHAYEYALTDT